MSDHRFRGAAHAKAAVGLAAALLLATPLAAFAWTGYSFGVEDTGPIGFTGIYVDRKDQAITGQPLDGCTGLYTGSMVYQTQWIMETSDNKNWIEIGTGHQCNDTVRYWFWGFGQNLTYYEVGHQTGISDGTFHTFEINRHNPGTGETFYYLIGGVTKGHVASVPTDYGYQVRAGLESHSSSATVPAHYYSPLEYQKNDGPFYYWLGQDSNVVWSGMSGKFTSDTTWCAAETLGVC
jgi:hypothetical protein